MKFNDQFELLELLTSDTESVVFRATEAGTGRPVYLHLFASPSATVESLRDAGLTIVTAGEHRGQRFAVTVEAPGDDRAAAETPLPGESTGIPQPTADNAGPAAPGEFTRMFQAPTAGAPSAANSADAAPTREPQPPASQSGEFTRMFQTPPADAAPPANSADAAPTREPQPPASQPGEFTRMFLAPEQPNAVAPTLEDDGIQENPHEAPPPGAVTNNVEPPAAGEFTRMFQAPPAPGGDTMRLEPPADASPPASPAASEKPADTPAPTVGEATDLFRAPAQPAPPPPASEPDMFSTATPAAPTSDLETPPGSDKSQSAGLDLTRRTKFQIPAAPPQPADAGAGEFTRMFHAPRPQPGQAPEPLSPRPAETGWAPELRWQEEDTSGSGATGVFAQPVAPAEPPPEAQTEPGPSEFTQVISARRVAEQAQQSAAPANDAAPEAPSNPAPAAAGPSKAVVIGVLAGLFLLAVLLVVYFALRG